MRILALLCLFPLLLACGFTPLHGKTDDLDIEIGTYLASTELRHRGGSEMLGQQLYNAIEDRFNPSSASSLYGKAFRLEFSVAEERNSGVVEQDGSISRFNIDIRSEYRLIDLETNAVLDSGHVRRTASFFNAPEKYASYIAEKDAVQRALIEMSEDYKLRLASFFAREYKLGQRQPAS